MCQPTTGETLANTYMERDKNTYYCAGLPSDPSLLRCCEMDFVHPQCHFDGCGFILSVPVIKGLEFPSFVGPTRKFKKHVHLVLTGSLKEPVSQVPGGLRNPVQNGLHLTRCTRAEATLSTWGVPCKQFVNDCFLKQIATPELGANVVYGEAVGGWLQFPKGHIAQPKKLSWLPYSQMPCLQAATKKGRILSTGR